MKLPRLLIITIFLSVSGLLFAACGESRTSLPSEEPQPAPQTDLTNPESETPTDENTSLEAIEEDLDQTEIEPVMTFAPMDPNIRIE